MNKKPKKGDIKVLDKKNCTENLAVNNCYNNFMADIGRPEYSNEQYQVWLDEMTPFLKMGYSLFYAMDRAKILRHKDSIYRKFRLGDWFCEKIEAYRRYPGELVNSIFSRLILIIDEKVKKGQQISGEEWRNLRFFAEKHRSCQPFFTTRQEVTRIEPNEVGHVLEKLETEINQNSYNHVAEQARLMLNSLRTLPIKNQTNPLPPLEDFEKVLLNIEL